MMPIDDTHFRIYNLNIAKNGEDHLASTDRGVSRLRKLFRLQVDIVANGGAPIGVAFNEADALIRLDAGNYVAE